MNPSFEVASLVNFVAPKQTCHTVTPMFFVRGLRDCRPFSSSDEILFVSPLCCS